MAIVYVGPARANTTIAAGWAAANNGDEIQIDAGTYSGANNTNITLNSKTNITITCSSGAVWIDGLGAVVTLWTVGNAAGGILINNIKYTAPTTSCILLSSPLVGATIQNCEFFLAALGDDGVRLGTGACDGVIIRGCVFYQYTDATAPFDAAYGVRIFGTGAGTGCLIDSCIFYSLGAGVKTANNSKVMVDRCYFYSNVVARNGMGVDQGTSTVYAVDIRNCIFRHLYYGMKNGINNTTIVQNNTFVDCSYAIYAYSYLMAIKNCIFTNNVVCIQGDSGGDQPAPLNCCFFGNANGILGYTACTNPVYGDPLYVNAVTYNYRLLAGSSCRNTGVEIIGLTIDYDGNSRPLEAVYDIGAFEYTPPPVANFTADFTSGCGSLLVNFADTSTNTPTSWLWDFKNDGLATSILQNPSYTYAVPGTYTVKLTATNIGGSDDEVKVNYITVNIPTPVADFTADFTSGCGSLLVNFADTSTNTPTSWLWDFKNDGTATSILQNPSYNYAVPGTYTVKLTATNVCGSDDEVKIAYITVNNPTPVADFTSDVVTGIVPLTVNFTDLSTSTPTSWSWDFKNDGLATSILQNPSYQYTAIGTYAVKLTATNVCGGDDEIKIAYITVLPPAPVADFVASVVMGPAPLTVDFTDLSTNAPTSWEWDFTNDGTIDSNVQNPTCIYLAPGLYSVKLKAINAGGDDSAVFVDYILVVVPWIYPEETEGDATGSDYTIQTAAEISKTYTKNVEQVPFSFAPKTIKGIRSTKHAYKVTVG